ncbi:hypothetical protein M405DRAFT_496560 [Rhizopogon salebrosus TDB-379]|nr:hypothetical protein M405DRAFT_496560 [Rhizopogon salebrosus TDB-379]
MFFQNWRENESREQETSFVMQRGLVYPTRLTNRLKSLILIKEVRFTHMPLQGHHIYLRQLTNSSSNISILYFTTQVHVHFS